MTTLAGIATYPDGSPASHAKVIVRLVASVDGLAPGYAGDRGIYGLSHAKVAADGAWSVEGLTPNDDPALVPAGTVYEVLVQVPGRPVTVSHAALTTAGGGVQQLRDVLTDPPGALPSPHVHPEIAATDAALRASTIGAVLHGVNPNVERPSGFAKIEWTGSVAPANAVDGVDTWVVVT